jgi:small subunit ribosomal protein S18
MARTNMRTTKRAPKDLGRRIKKKPCQLCKDNVEWVDYKNSGMLKRYMSERGKIRARRVSGNCEQHQREIAEAIKTARELALLPYTQRTVTERRGGGRGRDRDGRGRGGPRGETEERTMASAEGEEQARERDRDRGPRSERPSAPDGGESGGAAAPEAAVTPGADRDPAATDPAVTESAVTESAATESAPTESAPSESAATEVAAATDGAPAEAAAEVAEESA